MAHKTKDGKRSFTNSSMARQYDRRNAQPSTGAEQQKPESDLADEQQDGAWGSEGEDGEQDGKALAEQHGPAHKITVQHDESSGAHHVQVEHPDGHSHMSQHGSADAAHDFAKDCAGCSGGM